MDGRWSRIFASPAPCQKESRIASAEISRTRLAANRENAKRSTGPTSATGKAISCQNHVNNGLTRKNGTFRLLPTEDATEYGMTFIGLIDEYQAETSTEVALSPLHGRVPMAEKPRAELPGFVLR